MLVCLGIQLPVVQSVLSSLWQCGFAVFHDDKATTPEPSL